MPASQHIDVFNGLEIFAEPTKKPDPVFFTDQAPEFEVTLRNNDAKYEWSEDSSIRWTIETGKGDIIHTDKVEFGPLDNGEETTIMAGGEILAYEGHGVFGVATGSASSTSTNRRRLKAGRERNTDPVYSYSVWDRSHYNASVQWPKRLQIGLIVTSIVLILFAVVQIGLVIA